MAKINKTESIFKKIWNFLWHSNSIWSWIVDLILIFLIVKFIVFPVFMLCLGTPLPFVIIESGSLEHKIVSYGSMPPNICGMSFEKSEDISGNFSRYWQYCGSWYEEHNINKEQFETWPYLRGMNKGDIIVVRGMRDYSYKEGEIIIFRRTDPKYKTPIIHRITSIETNDANVIFSTKGDHNSGQWDYEHEIEKEQVLGKAVAKIPKLGWIKLFFVELFK